MRVPCARCGVEHDLFNLEPSYARPDAVDRIPGGTESPSVQLNKNLCVLANTEGIRQYFLRVLIPVEVEGRDRPCCWGIWTEVSRETYDRVGELWDDPLQAEYGPWPARLANNVAGYAPTIDLRGTLRFVDITEIPHFAFDPDVGHTFAIECRTGVSAERLTGWLMLFMRHEGTS